MSAAAIREEIKSLATTEIPESLAELGEKHKFVNEVIQWCESSYVTGNKREVTAQTKEYIVDALETVTKEIEETCGKLSRFLELQNEAIDGVATQLEVVKERFAVSKLQNSQERLDQFRTAVAVPRRLDKIQPLTDQEREKHMQALVTYEKGLDAARFAAFDDVGTSLSG